MTEGRAPRFWLCYDLADASVVRRDCGWLQAQGIRYRMRGAAGTPAIASARAYRCAAVLVYLSEKALANEDLCREVRDARAQGKPIVVVRLTGTHAFGPLTPALVDASVVQRGDDLGVYRRALLRALVAATDATKGWIAPAEATPGRTAAGGRPMIAAGAIAAVFVFSLLSVVVDALLPKIEPLSILDRTVADTLALERVRQGATERALTTSLTPGVTFTGGIFPDHRIDVNLAGVPLDAVFVRIAEQVQLRLVAREPLPQRVDARFESMVWSDALDLLALRHGLAVQVTENAIYVAVLPGAARAAASSAPTGAP